METQREIQKNTTVYNFDAIVLDGKPEVQFKCLEKLVGERGFEPPTPWSRTRCSTRLSHSPTVRQAETGNTSARTLYCSAPTSDCEDSRSFSRRSAGARSAVSPRPARVVSPQNRAPSLNVRFHGWSSRLAGTVSRYTECAIPRDTTQGTLIAGTMIVLCANRLYTPQEEIQNPLLFIEDGLISAVSSRAQRELPKNATIEDLDDAILAPGFIDIHMHGGAGLDVMRATSAELPHLNKFLTTHGVTSYFPTTVAAPLDQTCVALERLANAIEAAQRSQTGNGEENQARPLGIHLEGPFLSHERRGVRPPEYLVAPTLPIFEKFWQTARGHVRMMTIAPELPGALEVIAEAARRSRFA